MNLFIHCISGDITGFFFDDNSKNIQSFSVPFRSGIIDELSRYPASKNIKKIFIVTGPASFTSLRNISVFCNTFIQFSDNNVELYCIPTLDIFPIFFPNHSQYILSVGKRESFLFSNNSYQKHKNIVLAEKDLSNSAGFFSSEIIEMLPEGFTPPEEQEPRTIVTSLLQIKKQALWRQYFVEIEYGAMPNIG